MARPSARPMGWTPRRRFHALDAVGLVFQQAADFGGADRGDAGQHPCDGGGPAEQAAGQCDDAGRRQTGGVSDGADEIGVADRVGAATTMASRPAHSTSMAARRERVTSSWWMGRTRARPPPGSGHHRAGV